MYFTESLGEGQITLTDPADLPQDLAECPGQDGGQNKADQDLSLIHISRTGLASVTVVGPDGTVCDGLATALFVLGEEAGIELWRAHPELGVQVIWVREDGSVALTEGLEENYQVNPQHRGLDMTVVEA